MFCLMVSASVLDWFHPLRVEPTSLALGFTHVTVMGSEFIMLAREPLPNSGTVWVATARNTSLPDVVRPA